MHITSFWSRIIGHGILTYVIGEDLIGHSCMHLENGGLLTWRYKHFHDYLMRHLRDVHFYYVVMYFDDIYYVLMMFGRIHTRKWDLGILFPNGMGWRELLIVGVNTRNGTLG